MGVVSGFFVYIFAVDSGRPYYLSIIYAIGTLLGFVAIAYLLNGIWSRYVKQKNVLVDGEPPQQKFSQSGINNAPHTTQHNEFKPIININTSHEQSQTQRQSQQQETKPPVIEAVEIGTKVEKADINIAGELHEKSDIGYQGYELAKMDFAFAELYRGADGSSEPFVEVRAEMLFFDTNENLLFRIKDAHWRKARGKRATFRQDDSDDLLVAVVGNGKAFPYAGKYEDVDRYDIREFFREKKVLEGKQFRVHVKLIGTRGSTVTLNQTFNYDLITDPEPDFRLRKKANVFTSENKPTAKEKNVEIARILTEQMEKGRKIMKDCARNVYGPVGSAAGWEFDMDAYIKENLGEAAALEFNRIYPPIQYPDNAVNREVVDRLNTKLNRLGVLISKLLDS